MRRMQVMSFELPDVAAYTKKRYETSFFDPSRASRNRRKTSKQVAYADVC